jgi:hypothetical protein
MTSPLTHVGPGPVYRDERGQIWLFENPYQPMRLWHAPKDRASRDGDARVRARSDEYRIKQQARRARYAKARCQLAPARRRGPNTVLQKLLERLHA